MIEEARSRFVPIPHREARCYPQLYMINRPPDNDNAITILQGRAWAVPPLSNWTSSFSHAARDTRPLGKIWGLDDYTSRKFALFEKNGSAPVPISPWPVRRQEPDILHRGCDGSASQSPIRRKREGLLNLGYCGNGLSHQRQAIDAGHDHAGFAGSRHVASHSARVDKISHR